MARWNRRAFTQPLLTAKETLKKQEGAGFSLLELLIVAVIILVLVSISTPLFRRTFTELELKETASNISRFITFSQQKAIIDRCAYKLDFDFKEQRYQLFKKSGEGQDINYIAIKDRFGRVFYLPKAVEIEGKSEELFFYPDGHSEPSMMELKLTNKNNRIIRLVTTGALGNVVITENTDEHR